MAKVFWLIGLAAVALLSQHASADDTFNVAPQTIGDEKAVFATVESAKGVPIVMITTEGSESHVVQALSAGARGYIRKPFTPDQVKEHVLPLVGKKP